MNPGLQVLKDRGFIAQCTDLETLSTRMDEGSVSFYVGIDPTGPSLHIGHIVPLYALAHLARAGQNPVALMGGGTARIGDPSGKTEMRKMITVDEINCNIVAIQKQVERFLGAAGVSPTFVNNADWLADLNYIEFLRDIGRHFSVNRMLTFEAYKIRMETGLSFIEFNYQLLQSFDFLELYRNHGVTLQIGGDDQWGNIVAGADLIRRVEGGEAFGLTFPLITTADGKKMGKTESGSIFLDPKVVSPYEMYQYWRNMPDADIERFLLTFTFLPVDECKRLGALQGAEINQAKDVLAFEATSLIHGKEEASRAREAAKSAFGSGGDLSGMPETEIPRAKIEQGINVMDLFAMTGLCSSKSDARRLVQQGGARVNEVQVTDINAVIDATSCQDDQLVLKAGKKRYHRVLVV